MDHPSGTIPYLPERIAGLAGIATNLSWSWNRDARALFRSIDRTLWAITHHNPIALLQRADPARLAACARDSEFLRLYDAVRDTAARETSHAGTWFVTTYPDLGTPPPPIAYFCAEFGLHNSVPIYSGGLGVLAGDHCKAASDLGVPLVAVGLCYTRGYADQRIRLDGWQEDADETFDPSITPLAPVRGPGGEPYLAKVETSGRCVHVGAWRMMVGRVPTYLLDTDVEQNDPADRELSHKLYAGGVELRLRQEWILGVGGVRVLRAAGIHPAAWHANEGHAAFMLIERLRELTAAGTPFAEAVEQVRATSVFTTHTPVAAGHDLFTQAQVEGCTGPVWEQLGVDRDTFFRLGHPVLDHDVFHMTATAVRLSARVNGVSAPHGQETRHIWQKLWPGREATQVPIAHVTNGVHLATWMSYSVMDLLDQHLGSGWGNRLDEPGLWDGVLTLDDARLWAVHGRLKSVLLNFIREEARRRWREDWKETAAQLVGAGTLLAPEALTIGFARRFATYKRADLIFSDGERLHRLLANPRRPVQLVFAGKAHPADEPGKRVLQRVYSFARDPRFEGRIAFLEDYGLHLAHHLVQGVDLWLNLPRPPLEACGTSGMKAALNAVPQLSTLDGWWTEGYTGLNGWSIPRTPPDTAADAADADAEQLFSLLEQQVVPLFYDRDERGIPTGWVERMKHALRESGARFTARRMVQQYVNEYYLPAIRGEPAGGDPPTA
ncbi:MAG: alpha-glucan family phosphorylase [Gemmatimonadetes bacterium]|nr:alpha-glucan family phosphorylase [Gemmatimonadota bacterium]